MCHIPSNKWSTCMFPLPPHNTLRNQCHYAHFTDEKVRTERGPLFPKGPNQARLTLPHLNHVICNLLVYIPISPTIKGWAPLQTEEEIWKSVSPPNRQYRLRMWEGLKDWGAWSGQAKNAWRYPKPSGRRPRPHPHHGASHSASMGTKG